MSLMEQGCINMEWWLYTSNVEVAYLSIWSVRDLDQKV